MDGVGAGLLGCVEDLVEHEVGLGGRLSTEGKCLVCELHELRVCIGLGVNGNAAVAGILGRPDDPYRDFTAVRDKHLRNVRAGMTGH